MLRKRRVLNPEAMREFSQAMAKVNWQNKEESYAVAETIVNEVREDIMMDDVLQLMGADIHYFEEGQSVQFRTKAGLKAYVHEPGSYAPRSTLTTYTQTITTELISVHPEVEIGQMRRYGTVEDIRQDAVTELLGHQYAMVWNTLIGSIPSTTSDSNYFTLAGTSTAAAKKAAVDSGFDYVADQPGSTITAIVGRRSAFTWLQDAAAWGDSTTIGGPSERVKEEIDFNPYQAQYRGVPVIMLNQYEDGYGVNRINSDNIMILGANTVKVGIDRPLGFQEEIEVGTLMWHLHLYMKMGVAIFNTSRNGRIYFS